MAHSATPDFPGNLIFFSRRWRVHPLNLFHAQRRQRFLQSLLIDMELAAMCLHVFYFVESAEQPHLDGSVLLGIGEGSSVSCGPRGDNLGREKNTNRIG